MKNLLLLFFTVASMSLSAQINVIKLQEKEEAKIEPKETIQVYDSLMSLNVSNVMKHVGQKLFLRGSKFDKDDKGFETCFYVKPPTTYNELYDFIYKPLKSEEEGSSGLTSYDSIIGRYYLVTNVFGGTYYLDGYCMELKDMEFGDTIYFQFRNNHHTKVFLTVGYYEKMKQKYIGQEFYIKSNYSLERIDSEQRVDIPAKIKFKCIDLGVSLGAYNSLYAIMENPKYGQVKGNIEEDNNNNLSDFISIVDYNSYVKRYGSYYTGLILKEEVVIGMPEAMVKASWGIPKKINTTTGSFGVHEQWVYSLDRYVYFENGKVTAIQN